MSTGWHRSTVVTVVSQSYTDVDSRARNYTVLRVRFWHAADTGRADLRRAARCARRWRHLTTPVWTTYSQDDIQHLSTTAFWRPVSERSASASNWTSERWRTSWGVTQRQFRFLSWNISLAQAGVRHLAWSSKTYGHLSIGGIPQL